MLDSLYGEGQCVTGMAVGMVGQFIRDTITVCWQCWTPCTGRDSVSQVWLLRWWDSSLGTLSLCVGNAGLPGQCGSYCKYPFRRISFSMPFDPYIAFYFPSDANSIWQRTLEILVRIIASVIC